MAVVRILHCAAIKPGTGRIASVIIPGHELSVTIPSRNAIYALPGPGCLAAGRRN